MGARRLPKIDVDDLVKALAEVAEDYGTLLSEIRSGRGDRPFWHEVTTDLNDLHDPRYFGFAYLKPVNTSVLVRRNWNYLYEQLAQRLPDHQIDCDIYGQSI